MSPRVGATFNVKHLDVTKIKAWPTVGPFAEVYMKEPHAAYGRDPATGLWCFAHRNFAWCGYVERPPGLKWDAPFDVHGGVTYAGLHYTAGIEVIGFDCAHYGDYAPGLGGGNDPGEVFCDLEFVRRECIKLAAQIHVLDGGTLRASLRELQWEAWPMQEGA